MPIKVAIVEDDARIRQGMSMVINGAEGFECKQAYPNAEAAIELMPREWPDVVLMDINLPKMSGIQCVAKLKELRPSLQIIMLTVYVDDEQIFESLKAGASGYLIKKTAPAEILEAIKTVHAGGAPMSNTIARKVVQFFSERLANQSSRSPQKENSQETENLTQREHEILTQLAKGYQYKEIAALLSISVDTVRTHLQHIYEKLHVRSRTEAVVKYLQRDS